MTVRVVDLFGGFGGLSCGAVQAGAEVVYAANHWQLAVDVHALNHPTTQHACQDLRQADWRDLPAFDGLLGAPSCQGNSEAGQPARARSGAIAHRHDGERATAWAIVDCADATNPDWVVVENVVQIREWRLYPTWCDALRRLGYELREIVVTASFHRTPQRRTRLFIVGMRAGKGHALRAAIDARATRHEVPFGPSIEWDAPGWRPIAKATLDAQARIAKGHTSIGARFLIHHVTRSAPVPLHEPIRTITTKDQWALVDGDRYRPLTMREYARGVGFPDTYRLPVGVSRATTVRGLGNAVSPPVGADVVGAVMEAA